MSDEIPEGLDSHPTDLSLGPHERCEVCWLWYPMGTCRLLLGKDRCQRCRDSKLRGGVEGQKKLL